MGQEIEKKFLVDGDGWRGQGASTRISQGFFHTWRGHTVRVRCFGDKGYVTFKTRRAFSRKEFEYQVPLDEAIEMLHTMCDQPLVEKTRHEAKIGQYDWTIDEFHGVNTGLILAEVELKSADEQPTLPHWIGRDVTGVPSYYNDYLASNPFITWCRDGSCNGTCGMVHPPGGEQRGNNEEAPPTDLAQALALMKALHKPSTDS
ncbi:MAG: CYTH domain-containing protein [Magnetococcales bacterium]|nr:CYTH domain-containing protein [Magnetococcales bacterium]